MRSSVRRATVGLTAPSCDTTSHRRGEEPVGERRVRRSCASPQRVRIEVRAPRGFAAPRGGERWYAGCLVAAREVTP